MLSENFAIHKFPKILNELLKKKSMDIGMNMDIKLNMLAWLFLLK